MPVPGNQGAIGRLCNYYLACLGFDNSGKFELLASKRNGQLDYREIGGISGEGTGEASRDLTEARQLLSATSTSQSARSLYVGFPTVVAKRKIDGVLTSMVVPLFVWPESKESPPFVSTPIVNGDALAILEGIATDEVLLYASQLEDELGLSGEGVIGPWDELAARLQALRPMWPWRSAPEPKLSEDVKPGIYLRTIRFAAERAHFTLGLEAELNKLSKETNLSGSMLGRLVDGTPSVVPASTTSGVLEVLPLNHEQREAIRRALSQQVTVITGPPGTGKSQVVSSMLINAAWQGKRVLFASKNNKAVDVVEARVNELGSSPVLVRLGAMKHQSRLAEYLASLSSAASDAGDKKAYDEAFAERTELNRRIDELEARRAAFIRARNELDQLEQSIEPDRSLLDAGVRFEAVARVDWEVTRRRLRHLAERAKELDRSAASWIERLFWWALRPARRLRLEEAIRSTREAIDALAIKAPAGPVDDAATLSWREVAVQALARVDSASRLARYWTALRSLQSAPDLAQVARREAVLHADLLSNAERLWELWLRKRPGEITPAQRRDLQLYATTLNMVTELGEAKLPADIRAQYQKASDHCGSLVPAWAVTSLSVNKRIPFEQGLFDLVVIDEASQCDIASALPLLYRAKAVVVLGDPKQLGHISALPRGHDAKLLSKHKLVETHLGWSYSHQSLFDLMAGHADGGIVSLLDHHRSHPDIIAFSNEQFYEGRLRVATRHGKLRLPEQGGPSVRWVDVRGRVSSPTGSGAMNDAEARAVVAELRRLILDGGYKGSIGIVSPFRLQANRINELVRQDDALAAALDAQGFLCDTVHKFQGDERDVMFFSPVVGPGMSEGSQLFLRRTPNLFNVAVTRARSALIVVGDRAAVSECEVEHLKRFADYCQDVESRQPSATAAPSGPVYPEVANPSLVSEWEHVLYRALHGAGVRPIPQYPTEGYLLDFAVFVGERKLNVEVDGERYHKAWDGGLIRRDVIRNQRLFEAGWDVMRFWVPEIRDDLAGCVARVVAWQDAQQAKQSR